MCKTSAIIIFLLPLLIGCSMSDNKFSSSIEENVNFTYQELIFQGKFSEFFSVKGAEDFDAEKVYSSTAFVIFQKPSNFPSFIEIGDEIIFEFYISRTSAPDYSIYSSLTSTEGTGTSIFSVNNFPQEIINGLIGKKEGDRVVIFTDVKKIFGFLPAETSLFQFLDSDTLIYQFDIISIKKSK